MNFSDLNLLIIDDEPDLLEMYQELFEMEGFKVSAASSGEGALKLLASGEKQFHLVISDSHMRGMSGLDILKHFKENISPMPVFYLATGDIETSESEIINLGGHGLILKPFELDDIIKKIKKDLRI